MSDETRMAWSGSCKICNADYVIYPHAEASTEQREFIESGPNEWEAFSNCLVCDGAIYWNGTDPVESVVPRG